jgi:hypothetical protein
MVNVSLPTGTRDEDWLIFSGSARQQEAQTILRPEDVPVDITVENDAVHQATDTDGRQRVFVRRGSTYRRISFDPSFDPNSIPIIISRSSSSCPRGSLCLGGVEYCCGSKAAVGNCYGRWKCALPDWGN